MTTPTLDRWGPDRLRPYLATHATCPSTHGRDLEDWERMKEEQRRVDACRQEDAKGAAQPAPRIYRIIRFHEHGRPRTLRNHLTLTEAQRHCSRSDTHGTRGGSRWFDGYDYMRGCAPRPR